MAANTIGSVRRVDRADGVILHVAPSPAAVWATVRLIGMLLVVGLVALTAVYLTEGSGGRTTWHVVWGVAGVLLVWWYIGRPIAPLLRTGRGQVTLTVDAVRVDLVANGAALASWPRGDVEDVSGVARVGGAADRPARRAVGDAVVWTAGRRVAVRRRHVA
jgi:hypothetical protein